MYDRVKSGEVKSAIRPRHRDYRPGPATIVFSGGSGTKSLDIMITEVVHAVADDQYKAFIDALARLDLASEGDYRVTKLAWTLL
jgi:hypothetical protein